MGHVGKITLTNFLFVPNPDKDKLLGRVSRVISFSRNRILVSDDGGASFAPFGPETPENLEGKDERYKILQNIKHIFILYENPLKIAAGTRDGIFIVTADNVRKAGAGLPEKITEAGNADSLSHSASGVTGMAQNPDKKNIFWCVAGDKLYWSQDMCESFSQMPAAIKFRGVHVSPANPDILYNPVGYGTIYHSNDGGYAWLSGKIDESLAGRHSGGFNAGFAAHPVNSSVALANFGERIFRTEDGGKTWTDSSEGLTGLRVVKRNSFYFHPSDKRVIGIGLFGLGILLHNQRREDMALLLGSGNTALQKYYRPFAGS